MKMRWILSSMLAATLLASCHKPSDEHGHGHAAPPPPGTNPVQHEMRLLHDAMRDSVTAIANGDVKSIPESLHRVHAAKEATEAALESGTYKPPKNGDKIARFKELDGSFHRDLEGLVGNAARGDVPGTAIAFGKAMTACEGCHGEFRR